MDRLEKEKVVSDLTKKSDLRSRKFIFWKRLQRIVRRIELIHRNGRDSRLWAESVKETRGKQKCIRCLSRKKHLRILRAKRSE